MPCDGTIHTYTGKRYNVLNPDPRQVDIIDIAHHLSNLNRFTGATLYPYSIAQHAVLCSQEVWRFVPHIDKHLLDFIEFCTLHHDDPEAYVNDLSRPLKYSQGMSGYRDLEDENWKAIAVALDIPYNLPPYVKLVDDAMCCTEGNRLLHDPKPEHWDFAPKLPIILERWSPETARARYLARHDYLAKSLGRI